MISLRSGDTKIYLPNPDLNDRESAPHALNVHRTMSGVNYVYVKTAQTRILDYSFDMTRMKAYELRAFLEKYYDSEIILVNHKNETWVVQLTNQPFVLNSRRAALNLDGRERVAITLQFEGTKQ